jgi:hypothetical protein
MSIVAELRAAVHNEGGAHLSSVAWHVANAFNGLAEPYWADVSVPREQAYTFLLLVAEALE